MGCTNGKCLSPQADAGAAANEPKELLQTPKSEGIESPGKEKSQSLTLTTKNSNSNKNIPELENPVEKEKEKLKVNLSKSGEKTEKSCTPQQERENEAKTDKLNDQDSDKSSIDSIQHKNQPEVAENAPNEQAKLDVDADENNTDLDKNQGADAQDKWKEFIEFEHIMQEKIAQVSKEQLKSASNWLVPPVTKDKTETYLSPDRKLEEIKKQEEALKKHPGTVIFVYLFKCHKNSNYTIYSYIFTSTCIYIYIYIYIYLHLHIYLHLRDPGN